MRSPSGSGRWRPLTPTSASRCPFRWPVSGRTGSTIVGTAVFPTMGDVLGLGKGAALTVGGLRAPAAARPARPAAGHPPGAVPAARRQRAGLGSTSSPAREARLGPFITEGPATPADMVNFGRVQDLPLLLGAALSLLALLTIAHLLLTSVRRRRRDFAVLRTLGFTRRPGTRRGELAGQCPDRRRALPAASRPGSSAAGLAWRVFAHQLGIPPTVVVPLADAGRAGAGRARARRGHRGRARGVRGPGPARPDPAQRMTHGTCGPPRPRVCLPPPAGRMPAHWRAAA